MAFDKKKKVWKKKFSLLVGFWMSVCFFFFFFLESLVAFQDKDIKETGILPAFCCCRYSFGGLETWKQES